MECLKHGIKDNFTEKHYENRGCIFKLNQLTTALKETRDELVIVKRENSKLSDMLATIKRNLIALRAPGNEEIDDLLDLINSLRLE